MGGSVKPHRQHRQDSHRCQCGQHPQPGPPDTGTHALHDLSVRRFGQLLRRQALPAQKFADGKSQRLRQGLQGIDARHAPARLPLTDGLVRHHGAATPAPPGSIPGLYGIGRSVLLSFLRPWCAPCSLVLWFDCTTYPPLPHPTVRRLAASSPHLIQMVFFRWKIPFVSLFLPTPCFFGAISL